jgi:hypothetical protein
VLFERVNFCARFYIKKRAHIYSQFLKNVFTLDILHFVFMFSLASFSLSLFVSAAERASKREIFNDVSMKKSGGGKCFIKYEFFIPLFVFNFVHGGRAPRNFLSSVHCEQ